MDFALLYDGQKCIYGWGNHRSSTHQESASFWINDFEGSDSRPWKTFENIQESAEIPLEILESLKCAHEWKCFDKKQFKNLWDKAQDQMKVHNLQKIVLALSDHSSDLISKKALPSFQSRSGFFYAFKFNGQLAWGYTPELFFRKNSSSIETVALAGTYKTLSPEFLEREKALDLEHSLVVEYFQNLAQKLNLSLELSDRQELAQGNISHLQTRIHLAQFKDKDLNHFISELHPTPALGVFPKNPETLEVLHALRNQVDLPSYYGAPFGFGDSKTSLFVVMIRGHFLSNEINNQILKRSIGVGITQQSSFEEEWAELEQKRKSMELLWNL